MRRSGNKILVIVLIVIAVLAVSGGAFAYVYLGTDILRSGQELFAKYLTQNVDEISKTLSFDKIGEIEKKLQQSKYEENIIISGLGSSFSSLLTEIEINTQNDPINKKYYGIASLKTGEQDEALKIEYMKEDDIYALRFTNSVKQFLSIRNSNLKDLAKKLGIEEEYIEQIPDTINFEEENQSLEKIKFTEEEKNQEIKKYSELLYNSIEKEKYAKSKNTVITVSGQTMTTNAYMLKLTEEDIEKTLLKILETVKQDEIILSKIQLIDEKLQEYSEESLGDKSLKDKFVSSIQETIDEMSAEETVQDGMEQGATEQNETAKEEIIITVYEQNGKTVRVKLEKGLENITLDTIQKDGKKQINGKYIIVDEDNTQTSEEVIFTRENENILNIKMNNVEGEEQQTNEIKLALKEEGNNIELSSELCNEQIQLIFSRKINIVDEIDYLVTLDSSNNIVLNDLSEEKISSIFTLVGERISTDYIEQVIEPMGSPLDNSSEAEKEAFNYKFKVYEGENVSAAEINTLLNTVFTHNVEEANNLTERYVSVEGDVTLDVDATSVKKVEKNADYTVVCKTEDGLINKIIITSDEQDANLENMVYSPTGATTVVKTVLAPNAAISSDNIMTTMPDDLEPITSTSSHIIGLLRTIGTIVVVMIILF